ncbi:MAG: hypothetical protein M3329_01570 [Pseudomonadota bacterium]|nr:hypothetical protein [Pseudomonadota bacterium]
MKVKLKQAFAGMVLTACMGITNAGETPSILGSIEYQALSQQEMAQIVGQYGGSLAGGVIESWRTNPPVSVNGTKLGAGVEMQPPSPRTRPR